MRRIPATKDVADRLAAHKADVGPTHLAFARGIAMWERGDDYPPHPPDDDADSDEAMVWLGYMLARGLDFMARVEIAELLDGDVGAVEHDPPWPSLRCAPPLPRAEPSGRSGPSASVRDQNER